MLRIINEKKMMMGFNYKRMTYAGILALNTKVAVCPSSIRQLVLFLSFIFFSNKTRVSLYALSSSLSQLRRRRRLLLLLECVVPYPSLYRAPQRSLYLLFNRASCKSTKMWSHGKKEKRKRRRGRRTSAFDNRVWWMRMEQRGWR